MVKRWINKVLKKGVKLKNQNEFIIPGKIRIVNENIYNENTDKNLQLYKLINSWLIQNLFIIFLN